MTPADLPDRFIVRETGYPRFSLEVVDTIDDRKVLGYAGMEDSLRAAADRLAKHLNERCLTWPAKLDQLLGRLRDRGPAGVAREGLNYELGGDLDDVLREAARAGYGIQSRARGVFIRYFLRSDPAEVGAAAIRGADPGGSAPPDSPGLKSGAVPAGVESVPPCPGGALSKEPMNATKED